MFNIMKTNYTSYIYLQLGYRNDGTNCAFKRTISELRLTPNCDIHHYQTVKKNR